MSISTNSPRVGVVVLNWRRPDDTIACLASLREQDYPSCDVIVIDNGSPDGSPAAIRGRFPDVVLIENDRNLGFAGGSNVGIRHAVDHGADYVLLLNDDTVVAPDMLRTLVSIAESDPRIGIVGPKIFYYEPPDVVWSAGGTVDGLGRARHIGVDRRGDGTPDAARDVDYVTGCALLVKRGVVDRIGMLDERFFAYFEETEWCARARRAGFRVVCVPGARMWHKIEPTARGHSRAYLYLMSRNRLLYLGCCGARPWIVVSAILDLLRTAASWYLRPRHREMRPFSSSLVRGVGDFMVGRFGAPPARP